jgi:hypothetical protein
MLSPQWESRTEREAMEERERRVRMDWWMMVASIALSLAALEGVEAESEDEDEGEEAGGTVEACEAARAV